MTTQGKSTVKYREVRLQAKHLSVRLRNPIELSDPIVGGSYSTVEEWEHALLLARTEGYAAQIEALRRAIADALRAGATRNDPSITRAQALLDRAQGARSAAMSHAAEREREAHKRLTCGRAATQSQVPLVHPKVTATDTVQATLGAVHRASLAHPHAPLAPDVMRGRLLDSARNAGLISSGSRKRSRRGGKRKQIARLRAEISAVKSTTEAAINALRSNLESDPGLNS